MSTSPIEMEDCWQLGWQDRRVEQIRIDYQLTFLLSDDVLLSIGGTATLSTGPAEVPDVRTALLIPEAAQVVEALPLLHASVLSSIALKTGVLRVVFDTGHHLEVQPDGEYEAWTAVGPGSARWVCLPRGGLAIWP